MKRRNLAIVIAAVFALIAVVLGLYTWFVVFGGLAVPG